MPQGQLRAYLGAAPGVNKTYRMLEGLEVMARIEVNYRDGSLVPQNTPGGALTSVPRLPAVS